MLFPYYSIKFGAIDTYARSLFMAIIFSIGHEYLHFHLNHFFSANDFALECHWVTKNNWHNYSLSWNSDCFNFLMLDSRTRKNFQFKNAGYFCKDREHWHFTNPYLGEFSYHCCIFNLLRPFLLSWDSMDLLTWSYYSYRDSNSDPNFSVCPAWTIFDKLSSFSMLFQSLQILLLQRFS